MFRCQPTLMSPIEGAQVEERWGQLLLDRTLGSVQGWSPLASLLGFCGHAPEPLVPECPGAGLSVTLITLSLAAVLLNLLALEL